MTMRRYLDTTYLLEVLTKFHYGDVLWRQRRTDVFFAASGGIWAVVTPPTRCGEGTSDPGTASPKQQTSRKSGRSAASLARLKLSVLHKINTSPWLMFAAMMSNHRVEEESARLDGRIAVHAEPSA